MSKKRLNIGVKNLKYAKLVKDDSTGVQYTAPEDIIGSVNITINDTTNSEVFHADDAPFEVATSYGGAEVSVETAGLSLDIQADLLGHTYENGLLKMNTNDEAPYVALMFESKMSTGAIEYVKLLKGKFKIPSTEYSTKTDTPQFKTKTIEGDFVTRDYDGEYRYIAHSDEVASDSTLITNWYNYVESSETTVTLLTP